MVAYGKSGEFFGLILPHGMLELTAVFIAAGVGLRIGWALIAPPPGLTRARSHGGGGPRRRCWSRSDWCWCCSSAA